MHAFMETRRAQGTAVTAQQAPAQAFSEHHSLCQHSPTKGFLRVCSWRQSTKCWNSVNNNKCHGAVQGEERRLPAPGGTSGCSLASGEVAQGTRPVPQEWEAGAAPGAGLAAGGLERARWDLPFSLSPLGVSVLGASSSA